MKNEKQNTSNQLVINNLTKDELFDLTITIQQYLLSKKMPYNIGTSITYNVIKAEEAKIIALNLKK
jgi:hypothetical protein